MTDLKQYLRENTIQIEFNSEHQFAMINQFMDYECGHMQLKHGYISFHRRQLGKSTYTTYTIGHHIMDGYTILTFIEFEMLTQESCGLLMAILS